MTSDDLYHWPQTRFVRNSLWRQWFHMLSELLEIGWELFWGNLQRAGNEAMDLDQSGETFRRILQRKGVDLALARDQVEQGCRERGYYEDVA